MPLVAFCNGLGGFGTNCTRLGLFEFFDQQIDGAPLKERIALARPGRTTEDPPGDLRQGGAEADRAIGDGGNTAKAREGRDARPWQDCAHERGNLHGIQHCESGSPSRLSPKHRLGGWRWLLAPAGKGILYCTKYCTLCSLMNTCRMAKTRKKTTTTLSALTTADAADLYGVSPRTVAYAKRVIRNGTSALTAALETGRISVRGAAWLADYADPVVQDWVVDSPHRAGVRQRLRLARYEPEVALRAARPAGPGDEIPRAVIIPVI